MQIDQILLPNQALVYSQKVDRLIRDMQVKQLVTEDVLVSSDKDIVQQFIEELQSHRHSLDEFIEDAIKINKLLLVTD